MKCTVCDAVDKKIQTMIIYEDDKVFAFLSARPATIGHVILTTKKHYTIMEQVPDFELSHLFSIANKISSAMFESFGGGGTNIIVNNGSGAGQDHPHFTVDIILRREGDGLDFQWQPQKVNEEQLSSALLMLKEGTANMGDFQKEKKEVKHIEEKIETLKEEDGKEDYLLKSLRRIP